MSWSRKLWCRVDEIRRGVHSAREHQRYYQANKQHLNAEYRAAQRSGEVHPQAGLGSGFGLLPWLLMGMGAFSNLFQGETPDPWIGGLGLLTFNSLYIYVTFRAFRKETREATSTRVALVLMGLVTCGLAMGYGGNWLLFFPLLGLATGAVVRLPHLRWVGTVVAVVAGAASVLRDGWGGLDTAYATWISTMVTAAIMSLSEAVRQLRAAREELARRAVEEERLRFSRDLHDLLGHTLSVIVVKSEAARRLAPRDLDAALAQVLDIESVGRQALTEIREAVTGYREGSLSTDLDRATSALRAAGIEPVVHRSGHPLAAQTEALLGWVVREAVTNVVRHSGAGHCEISVRGSAERVMLRVWDDGRGRSTEPRLPWTGGGRGATGKTRPSGTGGQGAALETHPHGMDGRGVAVEMHPPGTSGRGAAVETHPPGTDGRGTATETHPLRADDRGTAVKSHPHGIDDQGTAGETRPPRTADPGAVVGTHLPETDSRGTLLETRPPGTDDRGAAKETHPPATDNRRTATDTPPPPTDTHGTAADTPPPTTHRADPATRTVAGPAWVGNAPGIGGTGLKGLAERLAAAGGWLEAGPGPRGGFVVRAELPVESVEAVRPDETAGVEDGPLIGETAR